MKYTWKRYISVGELKNVEIDCWCTYYYLKKKKNLKSLIIGLNFNLMAVSEIWRLLSHYIPRCGAQATRKEVCFTCLRQQKLLEGTYISWSMHILFCHLYPHFFIAFNISLDHGKGKLYYPIRHKSNCDKFIQRLVCLNSGNFTFLFSLIYLKLTTEMYLISYSGLDFFVPTFCSH